MRTLHRLKIRVWVCSLMKETVQAAGRKRELIISESEQLRNALQTELAASRSESAKHFQEFSSKTLRELGLTRDALQTDLLNHKTHNAVRFESLETRINKSVYRNRFGKDCVSKGSLRNAFQLLQRGCPVVLYRACQQESCSEPEFTLHELRSLGDLRELVDGEPSIVKRALAVLENGAKGERPSSVSQASLL